MCASPWVSRTEDEGFKQPRTGLDKIATWATRFLRAATTRGGAVGRRVSVVPRLTHTHTHTHQQLTPPPHFPRIYKLHVYLQNCIQCPRIYKHPGAAHPRYCTVGNTMLVCRYLVYQFSFVSGRKKQLHTRTLMLKKYESCEMNEVR